MGQARLSHRVKMIKERYLNRVSATQKTFISDVSVEYGHTMEKIKEMFTRETAGELKLSRKQLYEAFDSDQDTFCEQVENAGIHVDPEGDVLNELAECLGKHVKKIRKRTTFVMMVAILLTLVLWAGFFVLQNVRIDQAVMKNIEVSKIVKETVDGKGNHDDGNRWHFRCVRGNGGIFLCGNAVCCRTVCYHGNLEDGCARIGCQYERTYRGTDGIYRIRELIGRKGK